MFGIRIAVLPMQISLTKNSDVPMRQQLAEQIVFQITSGKLLAGEEMPSVRALARRVHVHHNTVSEAYQELVRRGWLTRRHGSRLVVGAPTNGRAVSSSLDELINESIRRAKEAGYSLQALQRRVRERLLAEPPDHVLVVEDEPGLCRIFREEITRRIAWPVEVCSWQQLRAESALAVGAQVLAPRHIAEDVKQLVSPQRPVIPITYSPVDEHLEAIRNLKRPSIIAVASVSESLMKTARGLFAPALGRRHCFQEIQISGKGKQNTDGADIVFCDSVAMPLVSGGKKVHYQLIPESCLDDLKAALDPNA